MVRATGSRVLRNTVAGTWKFHTGGDFFATTEALVRATEELVNENPGKGTVRRALVRSTGHGEIGIYLEYEKHPDEPIEMSEWRWNFHRYFKHRFGNAYKGSDLPGMVTEIILEDV